MCFDFRFYNVYLSLFILTKTRYQMFRFKPTIYKSISLLLFLSMMYTAFSQSIKRQTISSYGSTSSVANVTYSQSVGQTYSTQGVENKIIHAGFQQPVQYKLEEVPHVSLKTLNITVFPNPATNSITLSSNEELNETFISVSDLNGKSILQTKLPYLTTHTIQCSQWPSGTYFIHVKDTSNSQKILKLIISNK